MGLFLYLCIMDKKSLQRHITISKLMRTYKQVDFHNTYTFVYGTLDDFGVESFNICKDWDTPDGLGKLSSDLLSMELRARYNHHRNTEVYQLMINNDLVEKVKQLFKEGKFLEAKKLLIG